MQRTGGLRPGRVARSAAPGPEGDADRGDGRPAALPAVILGKRDVRARYENEQEAAMPSAGNALKQAPETAAVSSTTMGPR
jgi:hypothetical protein